MNRRNAFVSNITWHLKDMDSKLEFLELWKRGRRPCRTSVCPSLGELWVVKVIWSKGLHPSATSLSELGVVTLKFMASDVHKDRVLAERPRSKDRGSFYTLKKLPPPNPEKIETTCYCMSVPFIVIGHRCVSSHLFNVLVFCLLSCCSPISHKKASECLRVPTVLKFLAWVCSVTFHLIGYWVHLRSVLVLGLSYVSLVYLRSVIQFLAPTVSLSISMSFLSLWVTY